MAESQGELQFTSFREYGCNAPLVPLGFIRFSTSNKALDPEPFLSRPKSAPSGKGGGGEFRTGRSWEVSRLHRTAVEFHSNTHFRLVQGYGFIAAAVVAVKCAHSSDQIKQPIRSV